MQLVETLLELHRTKRSGVIRFERGSMKKQLVLSSGTLSYAESNTPQEHLAQVLVKLDLLNRKYLRQISSLMKSGKPSDEAAALSAGLDNESIAKGLHFQAITILASLFSWMDGDLRLFDSEKLPGRRCTLGLPLPQALVEAARRAVASGSSLAASRPDSGVIFADNHAYAELPLDREEAYTYSLLKDGTPASLLQAVLPPGSTRPAELIQRLFLLGLIRVEPSTPESSSTALQQENKISEQIDELLRTLEVANLYEILSLSPEAQETEIKSAYYEMARLYHPDRFAAKEFRPDLYERAQKLFTYITGAYTTLSNPAARANYDESRLKNESRVEATLQGRAAVDSEKEKMAETLYRAGRAAWRNKDFEVAVRHLKECVWLRPDVARYHHYLGAAQAEIAPFRKEAEKHLLRAIELDNANADSYVQLGKLYLKVGLPKKAEAQFYEALRWDPENAEVARLLAAEANETKQESRSRKPK